MLPGDNLETAWPKLNTEQREKLAENAGKLLKQMTTVQLPFFGELGSPGPFPKTETWLSYLQAKLSFHLNEALDLKIFDHEILEQFWGTFNEYVSVLVGGGYKRGRFGRPGGLMGTSVKSILSAILFKNSNFQRTSLA